jgi:hypothetical protein
MEPADFMWLAGERRTLRWDSEGRGCGVAWEGGDKCKVWLRSGG